MSTAPHPNRVRPHRHRLVLSAGFAMGIAFALSGCGGGGQAQSNADGPDEVNTGLAGLLGDTPAPADLDASSEAHSETGNQPESELEALIASQAAQLAEAYQTDDAAALPDTEGGANASLSQMLAEGEPDPAATSIASPNDTDAQQAPPVGEIETDTDASDPIAGDIASEPDPLDVDTLFARLDDALGHELDTTSEPFRTAVAMIALAAAQGRDPLAAIAPETKVGAALSPGERTSAEIVAELLASMLAPSETGAPDRASVLRDLADRLAGTTGLQIPRAVLCTEVRGFGRYTPFGKTDFLAGRPIRALVYVEVDRFKHREANTGSLAGLPVEEPWAIEVSQTLELYHAGEGEILAWKRPEEVVVETSRNKQRDFYLLTDIQLPQTLTVGQYQLKVIVQDRVGGGVAEALIPIGVVADPALAWSAP